MAIYIEAWVYSEGPASGSTGLRDTDCHVWVDEDGAPAEFHARGSTSPDRWRTWLATLQATLSGGAGAGVYSVSYSTTTDRVTIATTNATSFTLDMEDGAARLLGFTSAPYLTATSHTGEVGPCGYVPLLGCDVEPAEDASRTDAEILRHGRAIASGWRNTMRFSAHLYMRSTMVGRLLPKQASDRAGFALGGKVRLERGDNTAYTALNPDGYLDAWIVAVDGVQTWGQDDGISRVDLTLAVEVTS